jgi:hypothetical protein
MSAVNYATSYSNRARSGSIKTEAQMTRRTKRPCSSWSLDEAWAKKMLQVTRDSRGGINAPDPGTAKEG